MDLRPLGDQVPQVVGFPVPAAPHLRAHVQVHPEVVVQVVHRVQVEAVQENQAGAEYRIKRDNKKRRLK